MAHFTTYCIFPRCTCRFGKFGIETRVDRAIDNRSLVSDSWSTDVYASDSEPPETQYEVGEPPLIPVSNASGSLLSEYIVALGFGIRSCPLIDHSYQ